MAAFQIQSRRTMPASIADPPILTPVLRVVERPAVAAKAEPGRLERCPRS